jgi:hypothetical protein
VTFDVHVLEMWQEQMKKIKAAGFHARRMVQHHSPRGRLMIRFLVEPDHYGAAAPMRGQLPDRDHPQALALNTVSHGFTISVPEPASHGRLHRVRVLSGGFLPVYAARLYWLIRPLRIS